MEEEDVDVRLQVSVEAIVNAISQFESKENKTNSCTRLIEEVTSLVSEIRLKERVREEANDLMHRLGPHQDENTLAQRGVQSTSVEDSTDVKRTLEYDIKSVERKILDNEKQVGVNIVFTIEIITILLL